MNEATVQEYQLHQKFMIVISERPTNSTNTLDVTFQILWSNRLVNSHVLIQDEIDFWSLYTFMPYQKDCFNLSHIKMISFSTHSNFDDDMTIHTEDLYPEKLKNFNKCSIYIAASIVNPFLFPRNKSDENHIYKGIDIDIITQIAKSLNFSIEYKYSFDGTGHGIIFPNGSVTGNLGLVRIKFLQ